MNRNFNHLYNFDRGAMKNLEKISDEIDSELQSETPDNEKLLKLKMQHMMVGLELNAGTTANRYGLRPY